MKILTQCWLLAGAAVLLWTGGAAGQYDRRARQSPELVVEAGGRTGACDALTFTSDGQQLLAAGDDKVVRVWDFTADNQLRAKEPLRWSIWRELFGQIYALALDRSEKQVAIAGFGMPVGSVWVLDRATGDVRHALSDMNGNTLTIRALDFSPKGDFVAFGTEGGTVWLWALGEPKAQLLGRHDPRRDRQTKKVEEFNRVRCVAFLDEKRLLTVAESGQALEWNLSGKEARRPQVFQLDAGVDFAGQSFHRVILSRDRKIVAAALKGPRVVVRRLDGTDRHWIRLKEGEYPRSVAFNAEGTRLAVGIGAMRPPGRTGGFLIEGGDRIAIYDLGEEGLSPSGGFEAPYQAECLAFHPSREWLAVAGGPNHEVTIHDLTRNGRELARAAGAGRCLWGVAFSNDGRFGFQVERNPDPTGPNQRGRGSWRVFDLDEREFLDRGALGDKPFVPLPAVEQAGGWSVKPDETHQYVWYVQDRQKRRYRLELDRDRDGMPQCYTFLDRPLRLVVGHYYGLSVFELSEKYLTRDEAGQSLVQRKRLYSGHSGPVMAVAAAPREEGKPQWLVSVSRDQTLAAWNLDDWDYQPELGANFILDRDRKLRVHNVALGSPAWIGGLRTGDEVVSLARGKDWVFSTENWTAVGTPIKRMGRPESGLEQLRSPRPGENLFFGVRRGGTAHPLPQMISLRQRPLWRFFPAGDREWVLWMWLRPYYLCSTHGDFKVGWHVNHEAAGEPGKVGLFGKPSYYSLEEFRGRYEKSEIILPLLRKRSVAGLLKNQDESFDSFEPPEVKIQVERIGNDVEADIRCQLTARPRGDSPDQAVHRLELWLNDYKVASLLGGSPGETVQKTVVVPGHLLRAGKNHLTLLVFNRVEGQDEVRTSAVATIASARPRPAKPRLYGLCIGIGDYSLARLASGQPPQNLHADRDAVQMRQAWTTQTKMYDRPEIKLLTNRTATRQAILKELKAFEQLNPDDRVVLFFSGHGDLQDKGRREFVFICADYNAANAAATSLSSQELMEALAKVPCQKVVLLDACHAGGVDPVRSLTALGQGPVILASCAGSEKSLEHNQRELGIFTCGILDALDKEYERAAGKLANPLTAPQLLIYLRIRVRELLREENRPDFLMTPISFAEELEPLPLARK